MQVFLSSSTKEVYCESPSLTGLNRPLSLSGSGVCFRPPTQRGRLMAMALATALAPRLIRGALGCVAVVAEALPPAPAPLPVPTDRSADEEPLLLRLPPLPRPRPRPRVGVVVIESNVVVVEADSSGSGVRSEG